MAERKKRRFPAWWQALTIAFGGLAIGFTTCTTAFALGMKDSRLSPPMEWLLDVGIYGGFLAFVGGILLFVAIGIKALFAPLDVPIAVAPSGARVPISRATHPELFPDWNTMRQPGQQQPSALKAKSPATAALRAAVIISIAVSFLRTLAYLEAITSQARRYPFSSSILSQPVWPDVLLKAILVEVPYFIVLLRLRRGPDQTGFGLAIAAAVVSILQATSGFQRFYYFGFGPSQAWFLDVPLLLAAVIIVFAVQAWRDAPDSPGSGARIVLFAILIEMYLSVVSVFITRVTLGRVP
jgi:hypothetical protein